MQTPRKHTQKSDDRASPVFTMRTIINWIVEADRQFRMSQDQIDRMADRF